MKAYWHEDERRWVSEEESLDEVKKSCKDECAKEIVFGFLWDIVTEDYCLKKELLDAFFDGEPEEITKEIYDRRN